MESPTSNGYTTNIDSDHSKCSCKQGSGNIANFMSPEVYRAITSGDISFFQQNLLEDLEPSRLEQASPRGDTVLHIAAQSGHDGLVGIILHHHQKLVGRRNLISNDLPLHVAAAAGHLSTVRTLVSASRRFGECDDDENGPLIRYKNKENNTALHMALQNQHEEVARFLFE